MDNLTAGNPLAHRVRVYYDGSSEIAEGMPVCYNYLITDNWFGGSVSDAGVVSATNTTAEGSHNEAKYIHVCNPVCVYVEDGTPSSTSKLLTGTTDDFDTLQIGMFVAVSGSNVENGNYKITAISRSSETSVTDSTITLDMDAADGTGDTIVNVNNIHAFAGVVAKGGWCGKTGPRVLDIYVPNGAIVPVLTVLGATTVGRTILSVNSGTLTFGNPTSDIPNYGIIPGIIDAWPVAIAAETISSDGLVLARLDTDLFVHQGGNVEQELQAGYIGTVKTAVNRMNVKFEQTSGDMCLNHWRANCAGGGTSAASRGMFRFETFLTGTVSALMWGVDSMMDLGADITDGYYSPLHVTLRSRSDNPVLTNVYLSVVYLEYILTRTTTTALQYPPYMGCWFMFNSDTAGSVPDYLFYAAKNEQICMSTTDVAAGDSAANSIAIFVEGQPYHIPCYLDSEL